MSQKKDDVFELNFDDFNTGLLEKNLEEKGTNEFLNYYIKLNSDLEQKKKDLEKDKEQFASNIKKEIDKLNQKKAKLTKDYEKIKKRNCKIRVIAYTIPKQIWYNNKNLRFLRGTAISMILSII